MRKALLRHIRAEALFTPSDRLLLACSGGLDSTVLAYLLRDSGFELALAHVNFQLRGAESDGDEVFVAQLAEELATDCYRTRFATATLADATGESIQMAARRLRYDWLEQTRQGEGFDYIVTAHHNDDRIETFLLNFLRGSGLRGLSSIPAAEGRLRRPLLFTDRAELAAYAERWSIAYREDTSNATDDYERNYLRHHVLPHLRQLESGLTKRTGLNFDHLRQERLVLERHIAEQQVQSVRRVGEELRIDRRFLNDTPGGSTYLHYWLADYAFTAEQLRQALDARPGTWLTAGDHQLLVQPDTLIVKPVREVPATTVVQLPEPGDYTLPDGGRLTLQPTTEPPDFSDLHRAFLPADRVQWPLRLRRWRSGDRFQPFGMGGRSKKLQNFFTDLKLNRIDRAAVWLLCDAKDQIIWVVGWRTDERYRLATSEQNLLRCHYQPAGSEK